jgi:hypothetical protein
VGLETISESTFLLTELRYTLGQLHVQVLDLDPGTRQTAMCGERSIEQILLDLLESEAKWQTHYSEILHTKPQSSAHDTEVPLPVNSDDQQRSVENTFEHRRAQTIAMLERAGEPWPQELTDAVKQQIGEDRRITTDIAECRKTHFNQDQRPDLNEPLTTPH